MKRTFWIFVLAIIFFGTCFLKLKLGDGRLEASTLRATMDGDASISANDCNSELLLEQDFCIGNIYTSWKQNDDCFFLAVCEEDGKYSDVLFHYQEGSKSIERTLLEISEENKSEFGARDLTIYKMGQPYVDENGFLHMICFGWDGDFYHYWLCNFDPSGRLDQKRNITGIIDSVIGNYLYQPENIVVCPNGNIAFKYKVTHSNKQYVAMITPEERIVFDKEFNGEINDICVTGKGDILCAERKDWACIRIYKINGTSGRREILMGNLPYSFPVKFAEGSDMEHVLCHSDYEVWQVTGRVAAQRILKYADVEKTGSRISDVFRLSDGSYGFLIITNEPQGTMGWKERSWAFVRISSDTISDTG